MPTEQPYQTASAIIKKNSHINWRPQDLGMLRRMNLVRSYTSGRIVLFYEPDVLNVFQLSLQRKPD